MFVNVAIPFAALTNSELNYVYYLHKNDRSFNEYFLMNSIDVFVEDLPQLILQMTYAIILTKIYSQKASVIQWISIGLSIWKLTANLLLNYFGREKKTPDWMEKVDNSKSVVDAGFEMVPTTI